MADTRNLLLELCIKYGYLAMLLTHGSISEVAGDVREYCSHEKFSPRCGSGEVLVMTRAAYGRMRLGRCTNTDVAIGCQADILAVLDRKCSNRESCDVGVHTDLNSLETPCPSDMFQHLEADYFCEKVYEIQHSHCTSAADKIEVSTEISVSSESLTRAHCGSSTVRFSARPGQILNISIVDFISDSNQRNVQSCQSYLELKDVKGKIVFRVCAGTDRERHLLTSSANDVTAEFQIVDPANQQFLLKIAAIGCANITPPEGTWVQRDGDETTLGCHSGKHTWTLRCEHNQWVGAVGSCGKVSATTVSPGVIGKEEESSSLSAGMVVFAVFSVLVFICSSVFTIGVCCCSKRNDVRTFYPKPYPGSLDRHGAHSLPLMTSASDRRVIFEPTSPYVRQPYPFHVCAGPTSSLCKPTFTEHGMERQMPMVSNAISTECSNQQLYFSSSSSHADSLDSEPVKYYILENPNEISETSA